MRVEKEEANDVTEMVQINTFLMKDYKNNVFFGGILCTDELCMMIQHYNIIDTKDFLFSTFFIILTY